VATARSAAPTRTGRTGGRRPGAHRPQAHPGVRGRWSASSIIAALRAWVADTGCAPRRDDWSGQRPEDAGVLQRKWMREHPRWPSSSCVCRHFGSWSAALEAAGLPARRLVFDSPVAERVDAAHRLAAAGWGATAIAQLLGVSRSSVHNYLNAGSCSDCGGPVTNPTARRCSACAAPEPTVPRVWTRAAVREAIQQWNAQFGEPPTCRDWTPSRTAPGRWETDSPRWPSAAIVCDLYRDEPEPWNTALADAGVQRRFRRWSDDSIRAALADFWVRAGRVPGPPDLRTEHWTGPHTVTVRRRYGTLDRAWQILGPAPD
jgi:hypothetical protein